MHGSLFRNPFEGQRARQRWDGSWIDWAQRVPSPTCFPEIAVVAEQDAAALRTTVAPSSPSLNGTKAFVRRQSHGVGAMVALVEDGQVMSAYEHPPISCLGFD